MPSKTLLLYLGIYVFRIIRFFSGSVKSQGKRLSFNNTKDRHFLLSLVPTTWIRLQQHV